MPIIHTTTLPTGARFSQVRADRAVRFIERACVHTKSSWARKPFILADFQRGSAVKNEAGLWTLDGIVRPLFGAVVWSEMHQRYVRRFSLAWLEMARKNGKSEIMAALGMYLLMDGEESAEVFGAASDKDQASMVFNVAKRMIELSPILARLKEQKKLEVVDSRKRIIYTPTSSVYQVISADAAGNLGANPYAILFDEVLAQPNRLLWDYLRQGQGTRAESLMIGVTTAGPSRESFAFGEHEFSLKVAVDPDLDPKRFVYVAYVPEDADWEDESQWPDANPGLWTPEHSIEDGSFLDLQTLRDEKTEAKNKGDLSEIANFKIFRLNQWGNRMNAWLDLEVWDESEERAGEFTDEDLSELDGIGGFDLAETMDLAAWVMVFPSADRLMVKCRFWITRKAIMRRHRRMLDKFMQWEADELLTVFESDVHDYDAIRQQILDDIDEFRITDIGFDQFQAPAIVSAIESRTSVVCEKVPQTTTRMNPGAKELTRQLGNRAFTTSANPLMRWNASAATYKMDSDRHIKPDKASSTDSIDGITALVNALTVLVQLAGDSDIGLYVMDDDDLED